jgi:hypothetical protein
LQLLVTALARNYSSQARAQSLSDALARDLLRQDLEQAVGISTLTRLHAQIVDGREEAAVAGGNLHFPGAGLTSSDRDMMAQLIAAWHGTIGGKTDTR